MRRITNQCLFLFAAYLMQVGPCLMVVLVMKYGGFLGEFSSSHCWWIGSFFQTHWCLLNVGNGGMGEWGNGMMFNSLYRSFPHSLISTSKKSNLRYSTTGFLHRQLRLLFRIEPNMRCDHVMLTLVYTPEIHLPESKQMLLNSGEWT